MNILILGKGYVGSALNTCLKRCYNIYFASKKDLDYTNRCDLMNFIKSNSITAVINTCGYTGRPNVDACESDKENTWYYNVNVPVNIQKVCKDAMIPMVHISSGCIYDGYDKAYTETDEPNFGLLSADSSWYSKTKHACEMMLSDRPVYIFRIRMPFCSTWSERNIITKLLKYDKIIDQKNSVTNLEDLCGFILYFLIDILDNNIQRPYGIYNVVNPEPLMTSDIVNTLSKYGLTNPNWSQISLEQLYTQTAAKRSNCVLSDEKITKIGLKLPGSMQSLKRCIENMLKTKDDKHIQKFDQPQSF